MFLTESFFSFCDFPFPHPITAHSIKMPLHLLRFHFNGLVIYLMELASLVWKANTLQSKYNWTDRGTTSGGCTCHSDHFPWAIWKISGQCLYLPSECLTERALEHEFGNLGHSQNSLIFRAMWPVDSHFPLWVSFSWSLKRGWVQMTSESLCSHSSNKYSVKTRSE